MKQDQREQQLSKNVMNEKEVEEKNNENSQVNGMNNFISKIFGGKGQQELV